MKRRATRAIYLGPVRIGGGAPVVVQSMTNTDTRQVEPTLAQVRRLAAAGCEVVRLAVPDMKAARRLGVNAGSLEEDLLARYGAPTAPALTASALRWVRQFEDWGFYDFKISLKSSDVLVTVEAYQQLAPQVDYPLHLGVTEAGGLIAATVKSALGLGMLLAQGIGATLRVSLTR